jgi:transketolase
VALKSNGPVALILTRQNLPVLDRSRLAPAKLLERGAYVLSDLGQDEPQIIIIASGSEVHLALKTQDVIYNKHRISSRVVSMPSWDLFQKQSQDYKNEVLPPSIKKRLAIEAGSSFGWERWVGTEGEIISIDKFGASAPGSQVLSLYGFNEDNVIRTALALLGI